jgi:hypothetical protein
MNRLEEVLLKRRRLNGLVREGTRSSLKTVPHVPLSHPFVERLIGTVRRELLHQVPLGGARDLERKPRHFRDYYNYAS